MNNTLTRIIIFCFIFVFLGRYVPSTYYKYFDNTEYYQVKKQYVVETEVHPCDSITLVTERTSLANFEGVLKRNLWSIRTGKMVWNKTTTIIVGVNETNTSIIINLPCDLEPGKYIFESSLTYEIKGVEKVYAYQSIPFEIL